MTGGIGIPVIMVRANIEHGEWIQLIAQKWFESQVTLPIIKAVPSIEFIILGILDYKA